MPKLFWDSAAINYVQPDEGGPVGTVEAAFVDANLSQYTVNTTGRYSCCDVDALTLWTMGNTAIPALFTAAGADAADTYNHSSVWLNRAGDKLIFYTVGTFDGVRYFYLGIAPISATGDVSDPVLTNYIRFQSSGIQLHGVSSIWEMGETGSDGLLVVTKDFSTSKLQFWICPSIELIEAGTYKGTHPNYTWTDNPLAADQGPTIKVNWTHSSSQWAGYDDSLVHDGDVTANAIGFYVTSGRFYFVVPKAWMHDGGSGLAANWADDYPNGGAFYLDLSSYNLYPVFGWVHDQPVSVLTRSTDVTPAPGAFVTSTGAPALPWTDEFTRLYDGGSPTGWGHVSYGGRPTVTYGDDGAPVLLFGAIDGNSNYDDLIGDGDRVYYARVRGYKWTGSVFREFDTAEGIILRQGDLGFSGYNFDDPDSQGVFLYGGALYFQITQWTGMGGVANSRSVLTRFGRFLEPRRIVVTDMRIGQASV